MAVGSYTFAELESMAADRADIIVSADGRHTTAKMQVRFARSLKKWTLLTANAGDDTYLKIYRATTNPSATIGADTWAPRQYLDLPEACLLIRGVDIYRSANQRPISMVTFDEAERNDPTLRGFWWNDQNTGFPTRYRVGGLVADNDTVIMQIHPWADAVYTVDIRYIPDLQEVAITDFPLINGGEEYILCDMAMACMETDGRAGTAEYAAIKLRRDEVEASTVAGLSRRASFHRRDTWAEQRFARGRAYWRGE